MERPIVIEFSGVPNSGKTTLLHNLSRLCEQNNVNVIIMQESAEQLPRVIPKGSIEQNLWITLATIQKSIEISFISDVDFILLDRGYYNQLFWATMSMYDDINPKYSIYIYNLMREFSYMFNILPNWLYIIDVDVDEAIRRREALGTPVTFSKREFLEKYREKFQKFTESIDAKLYINTTGLSKDKVAEIVYNKIINL